MKRIETIHFNTAACGLFTLACAVAWSFVGCDLGNPTRKVTTASTHSGDRENLPKLSLHRPSTCGGTLLRMKELVETITADSALPQPLKYKVREVIHGTGAAAHSHYYRISDDGLQIDKEHDDEHEHEQIESSEKIHEVEVGPYTEMLDLARWLPRAAADADINEKTWNKIKATSLEIAESLSAIEAESSNDKRRKIFHAKAIRFHSLIEGLEDSLATPVETTTPGKAE